MAPKKAPPPPRAWQRMLSGRRLDLLDPSPLDIEIEDIAHGLARVARWNGQTNGLNAFSVAQHSLFVCDLVDRLERGASPALKLSALLHDAPEYVIGDMISPFKAALGLDYHAFEERLELAVRVRFGLPARMGKEERAVIKKADRAAAFWEATQLAGFGLDEADKLFGKPQGLAAPRLTAKPPGEAQAEFLGRYHALAGEAGLDGGWSAS